MDREEIEMSMNDVVFPQCEKRLNEDHGHFGTFVSNAVSLIEEIRRSIEEGTPKNFITPPLLPSEQKTLLHLLSGTNDGTLTIQKSRYPLNKSVKVLYDHITIR